MVVEHREESSGESRFGAVRARRSPITRSPRDTRNIAVALALLAFAVIMFLVTIVKFEEQIQRIGMSQTRGATTPPRVRPSYPGSGGGVFFPLSDARAWGTGPNSRLFGDAYGIVADFDRGGVGGGIAVTAGPGAGPERSVGAVQGALF